jgi:hypothetical protein
LGKSFLFFTRPSSEFHLCIRVVSFEIISLIFLSDVLYFLKTMGSYNSSSEIIEYSIPSLETITSRTVKFIVLLVFQVVSILCLLYLLFHLITKSTLRRALHNHSTIALIIISFLQLISDLPMSLEYLRQGHASSSTSCLMWSFFALSNYAAGIWTMSWTSLERHILIFHDRLIVTSRGKICSIIIFLYLFLYLFLISIIHVRIPFILHYYFVVGVAMRTTID